MADEFNGGDLRKLADAVEELEGAAVTLGEKRIPDPCAFYHATLRPSLVLVQAIVCNAWVKRLIGDRPCTVVGQALTILDQLCPNA